MELNLSHARFLQGAGTESRDSTLAAGRAALDGVSRIILLLRKGTLFLSLPSWRRTGPGRARLAAP